MEIMEFLKMKFICILSIINNSPHYGNQRNEEEHKGMSKNQIN